MPILSAEAPWTTLNVYSGTYSFFPDSPWKATRTLTQGRCDWEMAVEVGEIDIQPAVEFTNDTVDLTNAVIVGVGTAQTAPGIHPPTGWTSLGSNAAGKRYYRTGWQAKSVTASTHANARVGGTWDLQFD